jgi:hypothetical protein
VGRRHFKKDHGGNTYTNEAVLGLELLGRLQVVVDQSKASGLSTTESGAETEAEDDLLVDLVHLGELLAELILGDVGTSGVDDIHDLREAGKLQVEDKSSVHGCCNPVWCTVRSSCR